jgi:uncharacterized Ntn-hydrolase superfamily protein
MTFSVVGRCARTAMLGMVVASSSPAAAARCAWARAGVGAVVTQNVTDPSLGPWILDLMAGGRSATAALDEVVTRAPHIEYRQLAVIDMQGTTASYSGARTLGRHGRSSGKNCLAAGNLLADEMVTAAMVQSFEQRPRDHLADRLLRALRAGAAAGGEEGPVRSCGLLVVDQVAWPVTDLRVDWHHDPVTELARLWAVWRPREAEYVQRALDPASAPSYGVPGDE